MSMSISQHHKKSQKVFRTKQNEQPQPQQGHPNLNHQHHQSQPQPNLNYSLLGGNPGQPSQNHSSQHQSLSQNTQNLNPSHNQSQNHLQTKPQLNHNANLMPVVHLKGPALLHPLPHPLQHPHPHPHYLVDPSGAHVAVLTRDVESNLGHLNIGNGEGHITNLRPSRDHEDISLGTEDVRGLENFSHLSLLDHGEIDHRMHRKIEEGIHGKIELDHSEMDGNQFLRPFAKQPTNGFMEFNDLSYKGNGLLDKQYPSSSFVGNYDDQFNSHLFPKDKFNRKVSKESYDNALMDKKYTNTIFKEEQFDGEIFPSQFNVPFNVNHTSFPSKDGYESPLLTKEKFPVSLDNIPDEFSEQFHDGDFSSGLLDDCNVFVKYLPPDLSDAEFYKLFKSFGNIISSKIMVDQGTGKSLGYGFVRYSDSAASQKAIHHMNGHRISNKRLLCKLANLSPSSYNSEFSKHPILNSQTPNDNIYIKPLLKETSEEDLRKLFGKYGNIIDCKVMIDRNTGLSRQIGFVRFETKDQATAAIEEMNNYKLYPSALPLTVKFADTKEQKNARKALRQKQTKPEKLPASVSPTPFYYPQPFVVDNYPTYSPLYGINPAEIPYGISPPPEIPFGNFVGTEFENSFPGYPEMFAGSPTPVWYNFPESVPAPVEGIENVYFGDVPLPYPTSSPQYYLYENYDDQAPPAPRNDHPAPDLDFPQATSSPIDIH
eukprot:TRINITY_DN5232_c0_g1_i1.p1 TRINITY_DN5232_c0_g1~~TRINITY_DN5232_c0_g1_i1.p1  ORF type:complete len:711 (+),score=113.08 TRINITY_DN5232_c0_g1_i1:125-2257(+)